MYRLIRPLLFSLDAECAHGLSLAALDVVHGLGLSRVLGHRLADLPVRAFGIDFANPVGLAAGLDKNGDHIDALTALGFGHIEIGTTTPRAQPGNPKPRLFRLPDHGAIVNRFGFNNRGVDALIGNVERARSRGIIGINIGKNKDTPNERAVNDYLTCLDRVYACASYVTVNVSSPNTQGLRDLQGADALRALVGELCNARERLAGIHAARKPLLLKIAPDLSDAELDVMAEVLLDSNIDGVIATNTTLDRDAVAGDPRQGESGGLSGRPLMKKSTDVLRGMSQRLAGRIELIGVGGISCGSDAVAKHEAGAALVQLYTGLIYRGPALIGDCVEAWRSAKAST
ncbi:MAG: quinone-dependent dihydroorotate dehydrogenase [Dokdonella sp.]